MIFSTVFCVFVYVVATLNNNVSGHAYTKSNVNRMVKYTAEGASLPHLRFVREANRTGSSNNDNNSKSVTTKPSNKDDRLYFELPKWFTDDNTTTTTTNAPSVPSRLNPDSITDESSIQTNNNTITVDGEYHFRVRLGNGILRTERGEYELRDGKRVFKIRGYFQYITPTGDLKSTLLPYTFDDTGFHRLPDYEPQLIDNIFGEEEEDKNKDIDPKLLALLVG